MSANTKLSAVAIERAAAYQAHTVERYEDKFRALREELDGYVKYGKDDRAELVREQIEALRAEVREFVAEHDETDDQGDEPTEPTEPVEPVEPTEPTEPVEPVEPTEPTEPTEPVEPTEPTKAARATSPKGRRSARSQGVEA